MKQSDIVDFESRLVAHYKGYRITNHYHHNSFMITIYNKDGSVKIHRMFQDHNLDKCLLDFHNIVLKPYIDMLLGGSLPEK